MRRTITMAPVSCAIATLTLFAAASASAAEKHLFDPVLSLTESTVVNSEDEVVDPGSNHPVPRFELPCGTATDPHGDIYVSSPILESGAFVGGRLDVFNPQGEFLVRVEDDDPCGAAVDSEGNVYSGATGSIGTINLLRPTSYPPTTSTTYSVEALNVKSPECLESTSVAIDPSNDHLYVGSTCGTREYTSAAEGSFLVKETPIHKGEISGGNPFLSGIDVYGQNQDIYAAVKMQPSFGGEPPVPSRVYVFGSSDGHVKCEILGAEAPGDLDFGLGASVAVDQANGDVYVYSINQNTVYQFAAPDEGECEFIGLLPKPPTLKGNAPFGDLAVDDPIVEGEAGYDSPNAGYVYVTSGEKNSHLFAYRPRTAGPPKIEGQKATDVTETEAVLRAELNPNGLDTTYRFEYTTQAEFDDNEYAKATSVPVPDAAAAKGGAFGLVYEPVTGLQAGVAYRFRLVASNCEAEGSAPEACLTLGEGKPGEEGEDSSFSTYPPSPVSPPCPNATLRIGASASLPDCRAYELVTPPDTGGHIPKISILGLGFGEMSFDTTPASPDGGSVVFGSNSGALPGLGGGGFFDTYEALRDPASGWQSRFTGLTNAQSARPRPGGISPDHRYSFWDVEEGKGAFANPVTDYAQYLRVPAGIEPSPNCAVEAEPESRFELIGCGSLGGEPKAAGRWISEGGGHVIFDTSGKSDPVQLEPCAPPTGISAIYDRTPGGPTRCISVPPAGASAEVEAQFETKESVYEGTSADGTAVVFEVAGTLYARLDNSETIEVAEGKPTFAGISRDGDRVFYLGEATGVQIPQGEIYACEVASGPCSGPGATQEPIQIGSGGESVVVDVSADGSHVYFVSPKKLDGEAGEEGKDNLYAWDGESVRFIAVLDPLDVDSAGVEGLGRWVHNALSTNPDASAGPANDPSRTTPDGKVLVFESHADLTGTGYDNDGHSEVFRYDSEAEAGKRLSCISCNPSGEAAGSDARLEIPEEGQLISTNPSPVNAISQIANVSADGTKAFFQSGDALVPADIDGKLDVYEWEAQGAGGCEREGGCLSLISGGRSTEDAYLYAMTADGHDVFFLAGDILAPQDPDKTPSIYDARVDGGFSPPSPPNPECLGETCQPAVSAPGEFSSTLEETGSAPLKRPCPKGRRKVRQHGKTRCLERHAKKHHKRHRPGANRRAAR